MTMECLQRWLQNQISHCPLTYATFITIGILTFARFVFKTCLVFSQTFILPGKKLTKFGAGKGTWAVVTGASDGLGKEFALQLASAGFNILLVARNPTMLADVANEITRVTDGKAWGQAYVIDFAKNDPEVLAELKIMLDSLDIGVLVNNVGKSLTMPTYFADVTEEVNDSIVSINVNTLVRVTHVVLPGMIQRKRGLILNVGSFAGDTPSPMLATYSASKAFMSTFTSALAEEVKGHNITVQHLNTYFVATKMSNIRRSSALVPTPRAYVRASLSKIGLSCGAAMTDRPNTLTAFWTHAWLDYLIHVIGCKWLFVSYTHAMHKDVRRRALRKQEREAKKQ